jgi:hypothetical protein
MESDSATWALSSIVSTICAGRVGLAPVITESLVQERNSLENILLYTTVETTVFMSYRYYRYEVADSKTIVTGFVFPNLA